MSRTRLTALLVLVAVGATCTGPATATPPTTAVARAETLQSTGRQLLERPDSAAVAAWRSALLRSATGRQVEEASASSASTGEGPRDFARVADAGDVDGDGRSDVLVSHGEVTSVRSGRDGRVLLRRDRGVLAPVRAAGDVALVSVDVEYADVERGFAIDVRIEGLDRRGRTVWEHLSSGTVTFTGYGRASVVRLQALPVLLYPDVLDTDGAPAFLLGGLSGTQAVLGALSLEPALLSLSSGEVQALPAVQGAGRAAPWAAPQTTGRAPQGCYTTSAPVGPVTRVALTCDAVEQWSADVPLRGAYVEEAGDFDGDAASDVLVTTWGVERPQPREVARGTQVLSFADGAALGSGPLDGLTPLLADISGDGQPDLLEAVFGGAGVELRAVTLSGDEIWSRPVDLSGGYVETYAGDDLTGDGLPDGLVIATADDGDDGDATTVVVDGRTGRAFTRTGVNELLLPGLRRRGADLAVLAADGGRARATVLSGDRGARLMDVRVPGPGGVVSPGGAGTADLDRDGRRDLVVASRTDDLRLTTAFSATGRLLWQVRERAPLRQKGVTVLVVEAG